jgi:hypothetical protein
LCSSFVLILLAVSGTFHPIFDWRHRLHIQRRCLSGLFALGAKFSGQMPVVQCLLWVKLSHNATVETVSSTPTSCRMPTGSSGPTTASGLASLLRRTLPQW